MTNVVNTSNADRYQWGTGSDGWHLLESEHLSVIEELVPAGEKEQRHFHSRSQQFFYILEGEAEIEINGQLLKMAARDGVHVGAGTPHQLMNNSDGPLRFLVISQPKSHGDRTDV